MTTPQLINRESGKVTEEFGVTTVQKMASEKRESTLVNLFIYLGFYVAFNTVQVISRRVVGRAEETSTYSSLGFCTVNCRPTASNYQLSHLRRPQRWEARVLPLCHRGPPLYPGKGPCQSNTCEVEFCIC